jgi:hypothetical protein
MLLKTICFNGIMLSNNNSPINDVLTICKKKITNVNAFDLNTVILTPQPFFSPGNRNITSFQ